MSRKKVDWARYLNRHSSKSIWVIHFLNNAYLEIWPSLLFFGTPSRYFSCKFHAASFWWVSGCYITDGPHGCLLGDFLSALYTNIVASRLWNSLIAHSNPGIWENPKKIPTGFFLISIILEVQMKIWYVFINENKNESCLLCLRLLHIFV